MKEALEWIRREALENALAQEYRQYLTGHLQRPQPHLQHIEDDIEVGISHYRTFTADKPHVHPVATEHGYILQGCLRLRLLDSSEQEQEFHAGDFFVLQPTKILFIKAPGINDKTDVPVTEELTRWLSSWD